MEEMEDPTERTQEDLHEHAHGSKEPWIAIVALASAIIAALAAVTSLQAGHHANEAMIDQMTSADHWNHYQAKSIKASEAAHHLDLMEYQILSSPPDANEAKPGTPAARKVQLADSLAEKRAKLAEYKKDQKELEQHAEEAGESSKHHMQKHQRMAYGVTMFQVAIAIAAICVLTRRFHYFMVTVAFAVAGVGFLLWGLLI